MTDVSSSMPTKEGVEAPKQFSAFLLELSVRFVHLPPDQVDREIEDALRRVCDFLGFQRSSLWQGSHEAPDRWRLTHLYQHPDHATIVVEPDGEIAPRGGWTLLQPEEAPYRAVMEAQEYFPWASVRLRRQEIVVLNSLDDLPGEAAIDRTSFAQFGARSVLVFPLALGDRVFGVLSFAVIGEERSWTKDIIDNLHLISQVFAHALGRKIDETALRESEKRLGQAAAAAGVTLWSIECGSQKIWVSETGRESSELIPEELDLTRFLALVHPEDRVRVDEAYRSSAKGKATEVEYRVVRPDGGVRWAVSRGRLCSDPAGGGPRLMGITLDITERKEMEQRLEQSFREIRHLKKQLEAEVVLLRDQVAACTVSGEILGASDAIKYSHFRIGQVAPLDATVLILGETGTGKNLAAAAIHAQSLRKNCPIITVSCAALAANLIESELFGRDRGAFTGADQARAGRFEIADGGTIFLDEIGDLPLELQAKLLRVVQTGEFERLGSSRTLKVDIRLIAATNWDLSEAVREGRFRADLFYRLNVFPITMPPLRARKEDIPLLTEALVGNYARKYRKSISSISQRMLRALQEYDWPGNVRELENVIERAVIVSTGPTLHLAELLSDRTQENESAAIPDGPGKTLEDLERKYIRDTLRAVSWRIEGTGGAANLLGLKPSTLRARMRKLGIRRSKGFRS